MKLKKIERLMRLMEMWRIQVVAKSQKAEMYGLQSKTYKDAKRCFYHTQCQLHREFKVHPGLVSSEVEIAVGRILGLETCLRYKTRIEIEVEK